VGGARARGRRGGGDRAAPTYCLEEILRVLARRKWAVLQALVIALATVILMTVMQDNK
jgi:hypothetical protein